MRSLDELIFFGDYFEWQRSKAKENIKRHKITFEEATEVFFFGGTQYYTDESHSFDERRYVAVGYTMKESCWLDVILNGLVSTLFQRGKLM